MPTKYKDYPIYTYDEPAIYSDFSGGINTDPSNEHLLKNELRDCLNMHYLSGALVKRNGGKKLCDISCEDNLFNIQGIFLFTYKITYIIIAADGKLYQGVFNEDAPITLNRLHIYKTNTNHSLEFDPENSLAGLKEIQPSELNNNNIQHDGYIQTVYKNKTTNEEYVKNYRGNFYDVTSGLIETGDIFEKQVGLYLKTYLCIKSFEKEYEYPGQYVYGKWELNYSENDVDILSDDGETLIYYDDLGESHELSASDFNDSSQFDLLNKYHIYKFDINRNEMWETTDFVFYGGKFWHCNEPHFNMYNALENENYFINITNLYNSNFEENSYLIFQNYKKIQGATFNNKLYLATGTRIIEVYIFEDELVARPLTPYLCNYTEVVKIGYNYLSPYPELALASQNNTVTTSIYGIKITKLVSGNYSLTPIMNFQIGDSIENYYYRWEKYINGTWYTIVTYASQRRNSNTPIYSLEVDDADKCMYRVSFAKSFELETQIVNEFDITESYTYNDYVSYNGRVYKCLLSYNADSVQYPNNSFQTKAYKKYKENDETIVGEDLITYWEETYELECLPYFYQTIESVTNNGGTTQEITDHFDSVYDFKVDKVDGEYFGSATSVLFNNNLEINDDFLVINSCTKILVDGQKILFYGDKYNSGMWYKTIISNPNYITDRGCLSFKTTKNEELIKVIPFQGNLIAFANAENVGGSIHLIKGNGDDYDDESGYYSPYQRSTINSSVSCDNEDTIQICDNLLVFKYFNRIYYINASDLSNDTVKVTPCNDRVLSSNNEVSIPWDDNDCISEVTDTYYALLWKEKYYQDENGDLILEHPGLRVKMYYKMLSEVSTNIYSMPWLRDESELFNSKFIIYVKGKPLYLYNNILVSFDNDTYKDIDKSYDCKIHFKGEGLNYPSQFKFIEHVVVGFHRNQYNKVKLDVQIKNEAGHMLLDTDSNLSSINDLAALKIGGTMNNESIRIGSTIQDNKLFNTVNMFPCLLADTIVTAKTNGSFSLSSVTYNYTTADSPDQNPYDLYTNIIRPKEVK